MHINFSNTMQQSLREYSSAPLYRNQDKLDNTDLRFLYKVYKQKPAKSLLSVKTFRD